MDCPNCGKKPVGLLHSFTYGGVGFKKATQGYFKCKHCDTLLKQSKASESSFMPEYKSPFWILSILQMVGFLGAIWFSYYLLEMNLNSEYMWLVIPLIFAIGLIFFMISDWLTYKYWVIEETTYEEEIPGSQKVSKTGMIIFGIYALVAIASFIILTIVIDTSSLSPSIYSTGAIIYMLLIFGGAILLLNKFTGTQETESSK